MSEPSRQPLGELPCVLILDFGGQYTHLIARRVREQHVFSRVLPYTATVAEMRAANPIGIILSGGPASVLTEDAPRVDPAVFGMGVPVLGICYGMQLMAHTLGGAVERGEQREYGRVSMRVSPAESALVRGMREESVCWMSHTYQVVRAPEGFHAVARTASCPVAAMSDERRRLYAVQFHPEVTHTEEGARVLRGFLFDICGCQPDFTMASYAATAIAAIRAEVKPDERVLLGLSGGVDSSVAAALLQRAIGDRLVCVLVDHGLMRKGECEQVVDVFSRVFPVRLIYADASARFFTDLAGVTEPEEKRRVIGRDFVEVFREESRKLGHIEHFAQGTIYPDVIESGAAKGAAVIKSHHNVGGLPAELGFQSLIEPLRLLFKDEVRALGLSLGLPESLVMRQPFPGPGLAIRIVGEVTPEKTRIVRESDAILREEMAREGLDRVASQFFTVLTGARSVGVMGDERTYAYAVAIRAVTTDDFMTADFARIPYDALGRIAARIVGEVAGVNRVLYDVTTKPPASIEWE